MRISHDVSLPYNPSTNGVAENSIRRLKEGTRCTLIQSGLSPQWWAEAARAFVNYRNVTDLFNGQTPYFRRHGENYTGPLIPFGAAICYLPNGPNKDYQHTFASKMRFGLFMGVEFDSNCKYKGNSLVIDAEDLAQAMLLSLIHI